MQFSFHCILFKAKILCGKSAVKVMKFPLLAMNFIESYFGFSMTSSIFLLKNSPTNICMSAEKKIFLPFKQVAIPKLTKLIYVI